jgi:hypothetical protein
VRPDAENIANTASGLILLYGKSAETQAIQVAQKYALRGDQEGEENWRAIAGEIRRQASNPNTEFKVLEKWQRNSPP